LTLYVLKAAVTLYAMFLPRILSKLLLLWLLAAGLTSQAEGIYPQLSTTALHNLRSRLRASRPDTNRVLLLVSLGQSYLSRDDEAGATPDSARTYCDQAAALSEKLHFAAGRIYSLYLLGQLYARAEQDTIAPVVLRHGLALSQRLGDRRLEAFGWFWLGEASNSPGLLVRLGYLQRSRALFRQVRDQEHEAYLLKCIADIHLQQDHFTQAVRELLEVEALYRAAGHRKLFYTYDLLHETYRQIGDYKNALRYGLAALDNARATHDSILLGPLYVRMAVLHRELKQYPAALSYYQKAQVKMKQDGYSVLSLIMAGYIARILVQQHRGPEALAYFTHAAKAYDAKQPYIAECIANYMLELYLGLGRYAQAEHYAMQLVAFLHAKKGDQNQEDAVCLALGKFYMRTKRYDEARHYLQRSMALYQHGMLYMAEQHLRLFKVDSAQGRFPAAIAHYQRYKLLTDSVFNERKSKQLATLEIQYDTRRKEQNINLLTKQAQLQQTRLRQREWQRNTLLEGAGLLALLLGLGYNRYRLKQRSSRLLEAQQLEINQKNTSLELLVDEKQGLLDEKEELLVEKDWMLKEIHHRVKNNLQVVSSLLNTQADYLRDPAALAALRESQNRVQAMALVHQKLYQSDSVALVNMQEYIQEITERLLESFDCLDTVCEHLDVAPVELNVAVATPLGLILNEAITNTLKHAFAAHQKGTLRVSLQPVDKQSYTLTISDNGVGLPAGFDAARTQSLGLTMINGLCKQLNGTLHIASAEPGVLLTLHFKVPQKQVRTEDVLF
jgi:two-component sensor histidine kinase